MTSPPHQPGGPPTGGYPGPGSYGVPQHGPYGPPTPPGGPYGFGPPAPGSGPFTGQQPGPPRRRRTGLLTGIAAAALLVVAAILVTGLVSPGWMRSDDSPDRTAGPRTDPQQTLRTVVDAMNARNIPELRRHLCANAEAAVLLEPIPQGTRIDVGRAATATGPTASGTITANLPGAGTFEYTVNLARGGGDWCVRQVRGLASG